MFASGTRRPTSGHREVVAGPRSRGCRHHDSRASGGRRARRRDRSRRGAEAATLATLSGSTTYRVKSWVLQVSRTSTEIGRRQKVTGGASCSSCTHPFRVRPWDEQSHDRSCRAASTPERSRKCLSPLSHSVGDRLARCVPIVPRVDILQRPSQSIATYQVGALALALLACGPERTGGVAPNNLSESPVLYVRMCPDRFHGCRAWVPYLRTGDLPGPIWWLVMADGRACEVDGMVANRVWRPGDRWLCEWRMPRP